MNRQLTAMKPNLFHKLILISGILFLPALSIAQDVNRPTVPDFDSTIYTNPVFIALLASAILLMILIMVLSDILKSSLHHQREREKKKSGGTQAIMIALLLLAPALTQAQDIATTASGVEIPRISNDWYGMDGFTFWALVLFNLFELVVVFFFLSQIYSLLNSPAKAKAIAERKTVSIIDRLNASVSLEKEKDILLDHNYDGIQELDNDLPPWWKYGFYVTIIAAFAYMTHYHILKTGALQEEELANEFALAEKQQEEYRKKNANMIDENNVTFLTDESSINEGRGIYVKKDCKACHGIAGEGTTIAPNLTDDYWIHGGGITDVFKSIKYGWTEKGMKAWGGELTPREMHVLSSYVKSLKGSNPAGAKAPEGVLFTEEGASAATDTTVTDTTAITPSADTLK